MEEVEKIDYNKMKELVGIILVTAYYTSTYLYKSYRAIVNNCDKKSMKDLNKTILYGQNKGKNLFNKLK